MTTSSESTVGRLILEHRECSGRTAIHRRDWSSPCRWIYEMCDAMKGANVRVIDYGCGHGADVAALRACHIDAVGFDPVHCPEGGGNLVGHYDIALCTYVLNTLPTTGERMFVIDGLMAALKPGGHAFVTVRRDVVAEGWRGMRGRRTYQSGSVDVTREVGEAFGSEVRCNMTKKGGSFEIYLLAKSDG